VIPVKPFASYKWRWLSVEPSESVLKPPIFLGVLRVLSRHETEAFSTNQLQNDLLQVEKDTEYDLGDLRLARSPSRNIFRNSKQYWTGTGVLQPTRGVIQLTDLGRSVALGRVTQGDFASLMVQQTVLPNPRTYSASESAKWKAAGVDIRPLTLILSVINEIGLRHGGLREAFITPFELIKLLIPLAGAKAPAVQIADSVFSYRKGELNIAGWPDCAPAANDKRLAREFLLFLANFGLCRKVSVGTNMEEQYYLEELFAAASLATPAGSIFATTASAQVAVSAAQHSPLPSIIERTRTTVTVLSRAGQAKFRDGVLKASNKCCHMTGERILETLEAAHIVPVEHGGSDKDDNGLCLRVDIHRLFDAGHFRLKPDGSIELSDVVKGSKNYSALPQNVPLPRSVNPANVLWRYNYY
jgi:hypothetical protein